MKMKHMVRPFEVKEVSGDGSFTGYGSVFNVKDSYGDIVIPGAFAKSLDTWGTGKNGNVPMLWQHDSREPIGDYPVMKEDEKGLSLKGQILVGAGPTEKRAYEHVKAKTIRGLSIGYTLAPGGIEYDKEQDGYLLKQINLWEVSLVTFPANTEATVEEVKTIVEAGPKEFERFLREAGLSRSQAKGLMARGYDGLLDLREAGAEGQQEVVKKLNQTLNALRDLRAEGT